VVDERVPGSDEQSLVCFLATTRISLSLCLRAILSRTSPTPNNTRTRSPAMAQEQAQEHQLDYHALLAPALEEAQQGLREGGIPIGAALFDRNGVLLGRGHNRRVQHGDPSAHGETDAFRNAGRQRSYRDKILVTTLAPCWYCSGLIRQFGIGTVVVGESINFTEGGIGWLRELGVRVIDLNSQECIEMLRGFIAEHPELWHEDIGVE